MITKIPYQYHRDDIISTDIIQQTRTYNNGWGSWSNTAYRSYLDGVKLDVYGVRTSNYKALLRKGVFIPSNGYNNMTEEWQTFGGEYSYTTYKSPAFTTPVQQRRWIEATSGALTSKRNTSGVSEFTFADPIKPDLNDCGDQPNNLVLAAIANLRSEQFDLSTQLAELKDLPKLFKSFSEVLTALYRSFKRGNISKSEWNKIFDQPGHWLTYRYGIMPVVLSTYSIIELLSEKDEFRFFADSVSSQISETSTILAHDSYSGPLHTTGSHTVTKSYDIKGCARLYYKDGRPKMVSDLLVTSWELVTLSFVIDWFLNVGNLLASRAALAGSSSYDLSQNFLCSAKNNYNAVSINGGPATVMRVANSFTVEYTTKMRLPSVYTPKLSIDFDMNWRQYADAFALSLKLIRRLSK